MRGGIANLVCFVGVNQRQLCPSSVADDGSVSVRYIKTNSN
jgi:hypothetical protein